MGMRVLEYIVTLGIEIHKETCPKKSSIYQR